MMAKTALLIVTNPKQIGKILPSVQERVKNTLYIHLLSVLSEPFGSFYTNIFNSPPKHNQTIRGIYSQAATHCKNLDVKVLLSGLKYKDLVKIETKRAIDLVIFDRSHDKNELQNFINTKISNIEKSCTVLTLDSGKFEELLYNPGKNDDKVCSHGVLGGTFDRLHVAHKLLLSEVVLRSSNKITIGVTEENMLKSKLLWELIQNINQRIDHVRNFLNDVCPELNCDIVPISDSFGPSIEDPTMDLIVVSEETLKGGEKINEIRKSKNMPELKIVLVELIDEPYPNAIEENKISSSTERIRILGTLLKPIALNEKIPRKPYIIGLTGGIASGKSGVTKWISELGAYVINCDAIGHDIYKRGKTGFDLIVEHFGQSVVDLNGEINRKVLGSIVFQNKEELNKLNSLLWPEIAREIAQIITKNAKDYEIFIIEAAVLLTAGWETFCHEVWTTLVPREESINRLKTRNGLTEEQALARINSQPTNSFYVERSHVVFCTLWDEEYTKMQVDRAWRLLQSRLLR